MKPRQSLLDYAMNNQTKSTKEYPLIQELLFHTGKGAEHVGNRNVNQNKEKCKV